MSLPRSEEEQSNREKKASIRSGAVIFDCRYDETEVRKCDILVGLFFSSVVARVMTASCR